MKLIRRILAWIGILLGVFVLALVGLVALDYARDNGRLEAVTNTTIPNSLDPPQPPSELRPDHLLV